MKKLLLLALLLWGAGNLHAQTQVVEKTLALPASQKVSLNLKFGNDIKITAWDKKEAYVKVTYEINEGKLNEAFLLSFDPSADVLKVTADLDHELMRKTTRTQACPEGHNNNSSYIKNGEVIQTTCTFITYEIFLPRNADLTLETISANIELRGLTGTVNAKSISGFVDMDWSPKAGASVAMKTITGEVFSDLDIALRTKRQEASYVGYQLKGDVNDGGPSINLETISNNIYFRRKK
ncbi:hypothetical protein [Rufibacter sp. LB8]|uniref:hypothetical protein n=1 Tax=Rufibacter sp. LB8 TaxID=2777781 RepID=UPI00178C49F6|nr:hypothetical protein [Rufibacter sp. LB8]